MISELPLYIFTVFAGLSAGIYAVSACFPKISNHKRPYLVPLIALVLLVIGGIALLFHLGRPERVLLAFRNPSAGIAQEGYAAIVFGIIIVIDLVYVWVKKSEMRALRIAGGIVGCILVLIMASAYYAYASYAALHSPLTFVFFFFCALAMGAGVMGVFPAAKENEGKFFTAEAVLGILAAVVILIEGIYFITCGEGIATFIVGAICALAGGICALYAKKQDNPKTLVTVACICLILAVAISRAGFYSVL